MTSASRSPGQGESGPTRSVRSWCESFRDGTQHRVARSHREVGKNICKPEQEQRGRKAQRRAHTLLVQIPNCRVAVRNYNAIVATQCIDCKTEMEQLERPKRIFAS